MCYVLYFPHEIPIKGCVRLGFFITFSLPLCFHLCWNYFGQLLTENIKLYSSPDLTRSCPSFARNPNLFAKKSDSKDHEIWHFADGKSEDEVAIRFGDPHSRKSNRMMWKKEQEILKASICVHFEQFQLIEFHHLFHVHRWSYFWCSDRFNLPMKCLQS